ncbi:MAG: type II toxin-antitoxin system VapC family toxin [Syntrophobacteraceae bacterium]
MKKPNFVLDSFALLAYLQAEPASLKVKETLKLARDRDAQVFLSLINLGEIVYTVERKLGEDTSREVLQDVLTLPIEISEVTMERVLSAAHIKGKFPISYADAFAVALAQEMTATLITGDPEFKRVESLVKIMWL